MSGKPLCRQVPEPSLSVASSHGHCPYAADEGYKAWKRVNAHRSHIMSAQNATDVWCPSSVRGNYVFRWAEAFVRARPSMTAVRRTRRDTPSPLSFRGRCANTSSIKVEGHVCLGTAIVARL